VAPQLVVAAGDVLAAAVLHEAAHEEVQLAVVVVVEPDGAGAPARSGHACLLRDVRERPVTVVAIEGGPAIGGHVQVGEAVVVVIPDRGAHAERASRHPRLVRHLGERAVPVVLVEGVLQRPRRREEIGRTIAHEEEVHPPVVVVIQERATGSESLGEIALRRAGVVVDPGDAHGGRGKLLEQRLAGRTPEAGKAQRKAGAGETKRSQEPATRPAWPPGHLSALPIPGFSIMNSSLTFRMRFATSSRTDSVMA
jgi:hypothetical protein